MTASADEPFLGGFVSAVSADSAAVRLEARNMALVAPRVVAGTQNLVSSNGLTVTAWDTTSLANGWHEVTEPTGGEKASLLVANLPSIAVEGGRLETSVTWGADAVHWVRNKVIVPNGVTLTVAAGAVVKFGEQTGMFVEDGGTVKFNGNSSAQVVLTSFADDVYGGDSDFGATNAVWNSWSLTAQSGGTINDLYTQVRYGTVGTLPTLSMPGAVTASRATGKARVSVSFDTAPTKRAALTWRTVDGTAKYGVDFTQNSGTAVWVSGTTVYFDIPLVNLEDVQEVRTFTIELVTVEGANANPSRLKTTVSITGGDGAVEVPTCAESEESEAIRLETRDPDPKPEPVPATLAIEGGRLPSNAIWDSAATNFVLNTVVIPSGVTLTVVTNAVVYFTPNTGIKVEPGGALRVVGSAEGPALFTAATKGDWSLAVVSGGTFTDSYAIFEKTTISQHPTVTVPNGVEVSEKDGEVRVPVAVSGDRSSAFRVKWRAVDGTAKFGEDYTLASGEVEWTGTSQGTKYITIPISNDDVEEESETFSVELFDAQGANIGGSYRCTVLVRDGTAALVPLATCVESEESAAIRLETRDPDPKPEPVPASIAIEGGRLLSNAIWDSAATNFVLNTVVIPSGVTLTVVTNAYVHFTPYTGIKIEPGGALRCVGSQEGPVVFAAANDGDYTINVVSGGTFTDTWTAFRNLNYGGFGTASLDGSLVVDSDEGVMRIPVYISGSRTSTFSVDWEGSDGTTGTIVWNNANEGKKWIELPIEGRAEGFSLRLVEGRGINISGTAHEIAVKVFTSAAPKAVCAESAESAAVRFECRAEGTLGRALVYGTEYIAADGETRAVAWDSTAVADGWQANGTLVRNSQSIAIECGRLQSDATWSNDVTHLVRSWVVVPSGVTLRIEAGTVVKFCELTGFKVEAGGKLIVAGTEERPVVYTAAADDTIGGDSDLREATPNDGDYAVNIVSGGTYTDSNCAVRYTTFSNLGTATMTANALAALTDGIVRIPVTISTDRTTKFCVDWRTGGARTCAAASGRITWNSKNDGTKYIELPLVSGAITNELETFTVELYESQGINISTTARRCNVTVYSNDRFPLGVYAESDESTAVRFETREYDSDLEIEASESIAIEGGRLQANTTWSNNVTHLVRQWVVVPSGVTLTIQAGTVVKFLPYTGIKVEPGGRVNANGTAANNIIFTSVADDSAGGDTDGKEAVPQNGTYSISVISGGTFSTTETQTRYGTSGTFGSLYIMENAVAKKDDGWVKIPVGVSATSSEAFSVDWITEGSRSCAAVSGRLDWPANSTATKYIEIPLDRMAESVEDETFTVTLTFTRGINLNQSRKTCLVTLYDTVNALKGVHVGHAESGWCEFAPMDASAGTGPLFAMEEVPLRYSTRWIDNGAAMTLSVTDAEKKSAILHQEESAAEGSTIWNGADYEDGRYDLTHKILDADGHAVKIDTATFIVNRDVVQHAGRLATNETWVADKVHLVIATVTVPNGVTLTIAPDAIVKFMPGASIVVEQGGLGICKGAVLTHAYDDVMGGDTFFDGAETVPEDGGYSLSGDWEDDESTQYRYSMPLEVSGTLRGENRWPGHKTYIVTGNLTLASGATLTIEAGAVVKFKPGLSFTVNSGATLNAQGTRSSPVVFTSFKDDAHGGDTNGDGKSTVAQGGDWRYIWVYGIANLEYAQILFGGMADGSYGERGPLMTGGSGALNMDGCLVAHSLYDGIWNWGGSIVAKNCVITDTGWATAPYNGSRNEYINCIFYGNDVGMCYWSHWSGKPVYRNCVFAECGKGWCELNSNSYGDPPSGVTVANSLFWNSQEGGSTQTCGLVGKDDNIWGDPKFENAEKGDFRLKADSPCVDAGDGSVAPEKDYFNQPRQTIQTVTPTGTPSANGAYADIGIYEVQPRNAGADVDLEVKAVMVPETMTVGEFVTIAWREANIGSVDTDGKWYDKVELISANGTVVLLGTVPVVGIPAGGEKTITESSFRVPAVAEGACTIRVTANCNRDIFEGSLTANNVGESEDSMVSVSGIDFTEGDVAKVKLISESQTSYSMTGLPVGGGSLLIHSATGESFGAYVAFGKMPATYASASSFVVLPNGDVLVSIPPHSGDETAYLMLDSKSKIQNGALDVTVSDVYPAIYSLSKESMPNTGSQSLTIYGVGMDEVADVALVAADGTTIGGTSVRAANACELSASFALTGAKTGAYRVAVTSKDGTVTVSTSVISVYPSEPGKPNFKVTVEVPEAIRSSRWYELVVVVENTGNADGTSPIISVNGQYLTFKDPDGSQVEYESVIHLLGTSEQGDPLVIGAGEVVRIPVMFKQSATASSGGTVVANAISREDVHWGVFIGKGDMSDEEWNTFSAAYKDGFADAGTFLDAVYAKAALVASVGKPPVCAQRLYDFVQREKRGEVLGVVAGVMLGDEGMPKGGAGFMLGALASASPCVGATSDANGVFVQYAVPTGILTVVSDVGIITSDEDYELTDSLLDGCIFTWRDGNDGNSEAEEETPGKIARLLRLPLEEPAWLWMDNAALMAGVPKSASETVILDGLGCGTYRICPISATECLLAVIIPVDGSNTLVACRLKVASSGANVEIGAAAHIAEDVFAFVSMSVVDESSFKVVCCRQEDETGDKTYFEKTISFADIPQIEEHNAPSLLAANPGKRRLASSPDYGEETFPQISIGTFKIPFRIGVWPIQSTDTGLEETGCCLWQRETSSGLAGGFSIGDDKTFAKKPNKPGWVPGLVVSGKTTTKDTYWCQKRKFGTGDCSEEKKSMHSSSYTMSAKAIVSAELGLAQAMPEFANFTDGFSRFGFEVSASAKGSLTFVRDLTKGFVTWPSNGEVVTRDIDRNTYGVQGKFTVGGDVKLSGEKDLRIKGPASPYGFVMGEKRTLGGEVPSFASISGSIWLEYHHDWDKTGGKSYHSNTASYGADIELAPFFSLTGSKQWRNGKVTGGWKRKWRLNPFDDNNWRETTKNGDTTLLPWSGLENSEGEHHTGPRRLASVLSPEAVSTVAADIRIDETHALSVSSVFPCDIGAYGDAIVCRDYEYNGQKWQGVFAYRSGMAAGRLNEDGENVASVQVFSCADGTVRVFYLASTPVLNEADENATFASCVIKALYCRTLKDGVWQRRERISGAGNVAVGSFALSDKTVDDRVAVVWEETDINDTEGSVLYCSMFTSSAGVVPTEYGKVLSLDDNRVTAVSVSVLGGSPAVDYAKRLSDETDELHTLVYDAAAGTWSDNAVVGVQKSEVTAPRLLGMDSSSSEQSVEPRSTSADHASVRLKSQSSVWVVTDGCRSGCNCGCGEYREKPPPGCICKGGCPHCRQDCGSYCYCGYKKKFKKYYSYDPNEMVGPAGVGEERLVKPGEPMDYTIYFENQTNATAAAQDVYVTLPKDAGLDWTTFKLGEVVFGDNIDTTLSGYYEGESTYALPGTNWSVRTEVTHTADTVKWHLRIIDPTTSDNYPSDPYAGFLPPNDPTTHCGEGHLRFSVNVKEDATPGSVIRASAVIEFDPLNGNKPIETDPAWWNTVGVYHTPTLDLGDGVTTNLTLIAGQPFGELPTPPERKNWIFDGWYTGPNGTGLKATPDAIVPDGEFELYENWLVDGGIAKFEECEVATDEGSNAVVRVYGGNTDKPSSVKVYLTYNTAAAADVDLKAATVVDGEGAVVTQNLKFPLTLNWEKGEIGEKAITISIKADKTVEGDEFFTLQLAEAEGMELGEERVCTVTIRDLNDKELKASVTPYKPKKDETVATNSVTVAGVSYDAEGGVTTQSGGFVAGTGAYTAGSKLTLTAEARPGWSFVGWAARSASGPYQDEILSNKAKWQVVVTNDEEYVAVFEKIPYVRGLADPADGGKVSGSGLCARGKKVTLKAAANKNYAFVGWAKTVNSEEGIVNSFVATTATLVIDRTAKPAANSKTSTTITEIDGDVTYFAVFKSDPKVSVTVEDTDEKGAAPTGKGAGKYVAGTITGEGKYAPGKKVTLKAAANKGYVFAGWCDGEGAVVTQAASYVIDKMPSNDVAYVAKFITAEEDEASIELEVNGAEMRRVEDAAPYQTNVWCGVYLEWPVAASALSATTVKVAGLPAGLKFADKPVTSKIGTGKAAVTVTNVPAYTIYGAPTAASKIDAKTGTAKPSEVRLTVTTAGKSFQVYQIDATVDALPAWAVGTFEGGVRGSGTPAASSQEEGSGESAASPSGVVSLTVSAAGKVSGKALGDGLTYTLAAPWFSDVECPESDVDNPVFHATVIGKSGKVETTNDVTVAVEEVAGARDARPYQRGVVNALAARSTGDTDGSPVQMEWTAWQNLWKVEPWKTLGKNFDKKTMSYAILSDGTFSENEDDLTSALGADVTGRVTLKFAASGAVSVSGEFVTGYNEKSKKYTTVKVTGSATLVPVDEEGCKVFIYLTPKGLPPHARCIDVPWPEE